MEETTMNLISILFAVTMLFLCAGAFGVNAQEIDYSEYDRLTRKYVNERGLVDYNGLKSELGAWATRRSRSNGQRRSRRTPKRLLATSQESNARPEPRL
jgi:hypothetical protein